jgi:hypothetical protein
MDMGGPTPYCMNCRGAHWASECPLSTKPKVLATPLSTQVLSTEPLATLGEVVKVKGNYDRVKKWRKEHREEYNARMREYRKANR